jgi:hypothetical protein
MDENGGNNTPDTNVLTFNGGSGGSKTYETVLQASEIDRYSLRNVYPDWAPDEDCRQVIVTSVSREGNNLSWTTDADAKAFLIEQAGEFVAIVDGTESGYAVSATGEGKFTVRAANMMGGFGPATEEGQTVTGIENVNANENSQSSILRSQPSKVMEAGKLVIKKNGGKFNAAGQRLN